MIEGIVIFLLLFPIVAMLYSISKGPIGSCYRVSKHEHAHKKSCYDCANLTCTGISFWCGSKDAIEYRGTSIPGCHSCPFWKKLNKAKWYHKILPFVEVLD